MEDLKATDEADCSSSKESEDDQEANPKAKASQDPILESESREATGKSKASQDASSESEDDQEAPSKPKDAPSKATDSGTQDASSESESEQEGPTKAKSKRAAASKVTSCAEIVEAGVKLVPGVLAKLEGMTKETAEDAITKHDAKKAASNKKGGRTSQFVLAARVFLHRLESTGDA